MMPSCDQIGVPIHFHSSTTSGSASLTSWRILRRVSPRQSPSSAILFEMSSEAGWPWLAPDFFMFLILEVREEAMVGAPGGRMPSDPLDFPFGCGHVGAVDIGDRLGAAIAHCQFELALQDFDHAIDASLAKGSQSPQVRTSNADSLGAQRQGLERI